MIYLDTSVVVAHLLAGDRRPAIAIWQRSLVASTLLENATWTRLHARHLADTHGEAAGGVLGRIAFGELATAVLNRALVPFPVRVRTLDALHPATCDFLRPGSANCPSNLRPEICRSGSGDRAEAVRSRGLRVARECSATYLVGGPAPRTGNFPKSGPGPP